jgi:hypothetical protein
MLWPVCFILIGEPVMGSDQTPAVTHKEQSLCFMLAQLRDDLADVIDGLESQVIPYEVAVNGAKAQLQWVLKELSAG